MKVDLLVRIVFNMEDPAKTVIKTNATHEGVEEFLDAFIRGQLGAGADESIANDKVEYHVDIALDLSDDSIVVKSDTGNKGLVCGIVMQVLRDLGSIKIESL
ncbi:MAG: hypothetical protein WCO84_03640 [bacterium]